MRPFLSPAAPEQAAVFPAPGRRKRTALEDGRKLQTIQLRPGAGRDGRSAVGVLVVPVVVGVVLLRAPVAPVVHVDEFVAADLVLRCFHGLSKSVERSRMAAPPQALTPG